MKRTLGILLVFSILATLLTVPVAAALPTLYATDFVNFNNNPTLSDECYFGDSTGFRASTGFGQNVQLSEGVLGKLSGDLSLALSGNQFIRDYNLISDRFGSGKAIHYQYEFAMASNSVTGTSHRFTVQTVNRKDGAQDGVIGVSEETAKDSNVLEFRVEESKNTVKLFGEFDVDYNFSKGQWYTVDVIITRGQYSNTAENQEEKLSYMTILVNGEALTISNGKTLDGVKTNTQKFLIDGDSGLEGVQPFVGVRYGSPVRLETTSPDSNSIVYFDNLCGYVYTGDENYAQAKSYERVHVNSNGDSATVDNLTSQGGSISAQVATEETGNSFLKVAPADGYLDFRWGWHFTSYDRMMVELDVMRSEGANYLVAEEQSGGHAINLGNTSASGSIDANTVNKWIKHSLFIDSNNNSYQSAINGIKTQTYPEIIATPFNTGAGLRIMSTLAEGGNADTAYVGVDNLKMIGISYYPIINNIIYKYGEEESTNDYSAPIDTKALVLNLKGKILDTSEENVNKIKITNKDGEVISTLNAYDPTQNTVTITLGEILKTNTQYLVKFPADLVVAPAKDSFGEVTMGSDYTYGFKTGQRPFAVKSAQFKSKIYDASTETYPDEFSNHTWGYIPDKSYVSADVNMINTTGAPQSCSAILCIYSNDNRLASCEIKTKTIPTDGSDNTITFTGISYGNFAGAKIKLFVWDSMTGMQPINDAIYLWHNSSTSGGQNEENPADRTTPSWSQQ